MWLLYAPGAWGDVVVKVTSRTVPGSIPGGVTGDIFRGTIRRNHVPWGRLSLWKWVPGISPGVKAAGAYGWQPTTLVVPNVKKIRGLEALRPVQACCGMIFTICTACINHTGSTLCYTVYSRLYDPHRKQRLFRYRTLASWCLNTFTAIVDLSRFNNSCLKSRQRRPYSI